MGRRRRRIEREQNRVLYSTDEIVRRGSRVSSYARESAAQSSDDFLTLDGVTAGFCREAAERLDGAMTLLESGQQGNANVLLRPVYEAATTYAWIAGDPSSRLERFYADLEVGELVMARDLRKLGVPFLAELIPDEHLDERVVQLRASKLPDLCSMAERADDEWGKRLDFTKHVSFRGLYSIIYRGTSGGYSHPRSGLVRQVVSPGTHVTRDPNYWLAVGPSLLCWMLMIGAERVDWLEFEAASAALNGFENRADDQKDRAKAA